MVQDQDREFYHLLVDEQNSESQTCSSHLPFQDRHLVLNFQDSMTMHYSENPMLSMILPLQDFARKYVQQMLTREYQLYVLFDHSRLQTDWASTMPTLVWQQFSLLPFHQRSKRVRLHEILNNVSFRVPQEFL